MTLSLTVTGMSCMHCENAVKAAVGGIAGVSAVSASAEQNKVDITYDGSDATLAAVKAAIAEEGYTVK